jgi:hypothetical protein
MFVAVLRLGTGGIVLPYQAPGASMHVIRDGIVMLPGKPGSSDNGEVGTVRGSLSLGDE